MSGWGYIHERFLAKGLMKNRRRVTLIYFLEVLFSFSMGIALAGFIKLFAYLPAFWHTAALAFLGMPDCVGFPFLPYFFGLVYNDPSFWPHWRLVLVCGVIIFALRVLDGKLKAPGASLFSDAILENLEQTKPLRWRYEYYCNSRRLAVKELVVTATISAIFLTLALLYRFAHMRP